MQYYVISTLVYYIGSTEIIGHYLKHGFDSISICSVKWYFSSVRKGVVSVSGLCILMTSSLTTTVIVIYASVSMTLSI